MARPAGPAPMMIVVVVVVFIGIPCSQQFADGELTKASDRADGRGRAMARSVPREGQLEISTTTSTWLVTMS